LLSGVAYNENGRVVAGMGADFRDLNNDGKPDIFHTAMFADTFPLYKNIGDGFEDVTSAAGITIPSSRLTAWGTGIFDFDNDGYKDIFASCAAILDNSMEIEHRPFPLPHACSGTMAISLSLTWPVCRPTFTVPLLTGSGLRDFNNDGKIDVVVVVLNGRTELFINRSTNRNHWLLINLVGTKSNRTASVRASRSLPANSCSTITPPPRQLRLASDKRVHFGLGEAAVVDKIELAWPSGVKQELVNVKADQVLTIQEPK